MRALVVLVVVALAGCQRPGSAEMVRLVSGPPKRGVVRLTSRAPPYPRRSDELMARYCAPDAFRVDEQGIGEPQYAGSTAYAAPLGGGALATSSAVYTQDWYVAFRCVPRGELEPPASAVAPRSP